MRENTHIGNPATVRENTHITSFATKRFRIEAMMRDIADTEFEGGFIGLKPSDRIALEKACTLLCGHPKRHDVEVRAINSAARLLAGLRKRIKPKKQPNARRGPSMASLLAKRADNP